MGFLIRVMAGNVVSPDFHFARISADIVTMPKRKTPLELRGEQLKRRSSETCAGKKSTSGLVSDLLNNGAPFTSKDLQSSRNPKYIDTKLNELFPVKKSSDWCKGIYGQEKISLSNGRTTISGCSTPLHKPSDPCINAEECEQKRDTKGNLESPESSAPSSKPGFNPGFQRIEKCSQITFLNVSQLSVGRDTSFDCSRIDMDKALNRLIARDLPGSGADSPDTPDASPSMPTKRVQGDYQIPGFKIPLDFTLKASMHLVSCSSVKWVHRLISSGKWNAAAAFTIPCNNTSQSNQIKGDFGAPSDLLLRKALHSWKYPQSSLPSSIVSAIYLSASTEELLFLKKRQQDWEDSFHNLYYMLRRKKCSVFYVLTHHFVALFAGDSSMSKKNQCNAFISQSTNGLRSSLAENDVAFSMPLCQSTLEQATADDLLKLSEINKHNLGDQAHHLDPSLDIDNSPQSLLAFLGNKNVHALFDFLLNYRFFLSSLSSFDVPVLHSPVPFRNASLFSPEVRCKEMKRADETGLFFNPEVTSVCHSIEIKDALLPPWVVSGVCSAMASSHADFEASFTLEPKSAGLNIALDSLQKPETENAGSGGENNLIGDTISVPWLRSAFLRSLKHSKGVYTASVLPF